MLVLDSVWTPKLTEIVLEKGLLALIVVAAGYWVSKYLELDKQNNALKNKLLETSREKKLLAVERQLSEFYYPIYFRLIRDNNLWKTSVKLYGDKASLPVEVNSVVEKEFIIKNHREIIGIIESKIHLVELGEPVLEEINSYVYHIAIYELTLRVETLREYNPIDLDAPFPEELYEQVESRIKTLQDEYRALLHAHY